jgi:hypothetical protein
MKSMILPAASSGSRMWWCDLHDPAFSVYLGFGG